MATKPASAPEAPPADPAPIAAHPTVADPKPLPAPPREGGSYVFDPIAGTYTPMTQAKE